MRKEEKAQFLKEFEEKVFKRGMPVNVRQGLNSEIAEWAVNIAKDCIKDDTPLGVLDSEHGFKCPKCHRTIGTSGFYCKWCGEQLREVLY